MMKISFKVLRSTEEVSFLIAWAVRVWRLSKVWMTDGVDEGKALSEAASARREAADAVEEGRRKAAEFDHETETLRKALEKQRESYSAINALVQVGASLRPPVRSWS